MKILRMLCYGKIFPFSHQQFPAAGIKGPSAPDLGKVGGSTAGSPPAKQLDETYFAGIYTKKLPIDPIDHHTNNHFFSFIVPETRMAEVGSLSARANMVIKIFIWRIYAIFATNPMFLRVIANLQI